MVKFNSVIKLLSDVEYLHLPLIIRDYELTHNNIFKYFTIDKNIYYDMMSNLISDIYQETIISYVDGLDKKWYVYNENHWQLCETIIIKEFIEDFVANFGDYHSRLYTQDLDKTTKILTKEYDENPDGSVNLLKKQLIEHKNFLNSLIETSKGIICDINNKKSIDVLYQKCELKFYNSDFQYTRNKKSILCFKNCVIDLETGKVRTGKPGDYSTLSTNVEYRMHDGEFSSKRNFDETNIDKLPGFTQDKMFTTKGIFHVEPSYTTKREMLNNYLEEVFTDKQDRKKFIKNIVYSFFDINMKHKPISNLLSKRINLPIFLVYKKNSGLTTLLNFINNCFGEYVYHLPIISYQKELEVDKVKQEYLISDKIDQQYLTFDEIKQQYLQNCFGKKLIFLRREGDIDEVLRIAAFLENEKFKVFILAKEKDMRLDNINCPELHSYTQLGFYSKFLAEKRDDEFAYNHIPFDKDTQIMCKTFHRNPNKLNELDELRSVFLDLILKERKELME